MKKGVFIIVALLLSSLSLITSAQKCKFDKEEVDAFSKEYRRSTDYMKISKAPMWWIQFEQRDKSYYMTVFISLLKEVREPIKKDSKIMVKLKDGQILEFVITEDVASVVNVEQQRFIVSQWTPKVAVTEDQLKKLSSSPIEQVRTTVGGNECNMPEAVNRGTEKVMNMAACLLIAKQ